MILAIIQAIILAVFSVIGVKDLVSAINNNSENGDLDDTEIELGNSTIPVYGNFSFEVFEHSR